MRTHYIATIMNFSGIFCGILILITLYKIYTPKFTNEEAKIKFNNLIEKYKTLYTLVAIWLIFSNGYKLIVSGNIDSNKTVVINWSPKDKLDIVNEMIKSSGETGKMHPVIFDRYANCFADKIIANMTRDEYIKINSKSKDEQLKVINQLMQDCIYNFRKELQDSAFNSISSQKSFVNESKTFSIQ